MNGINRLIRSARKVHASLLIGLLGVTSSPAALITYDAFATGSGGYNPASSFVNQNPSTSTGYTGIWSGSTTSWFKPVTTNLTFSGVSGNAASTGALSLAPQSNGSYSRAASRSFTSAATQSTLWFSTLLQADANTLNSANGATAMIGFTTGALPTTAASSTTGATWTTANGGALGGFAWGLSNGNLSVAYQSDILGAGAVTLANTGYSITAGTTYLLLAKLIVDVSGNDVLNIWALTSPVSSEAELGAATWSISSADLLATSGLNTLLVYAGATSATGTPTDTTLFDAIAVGTSFPDLNVVPEPSVNAALFLSVVILSWRAIRRRNNFQLRRGGGHA